MSRQTSVMGHLRILRRMAPALLVSFLGATVAPAIGASTPLVPATAASVPEFTTLDQFDTLLLARDRMVWSVRNESGGPDAAIFGKRLTQYADQYVFSVSDASLRELRARAASQPAGSAQAETFRQARDMLELEAFRLEVLYAWKRLSSNVTAHESALQDFLDKSPETERRQTRARLDPLLEEARTSLDRLLPLSPLDELKRAVDRDAANTLPQAFNEERMRLAPFAAAWDRENGVAPMTRTRSKPCSPANSKPSPTGKPQVDPASAGEPEYPPDARRIGFEGKVAIRADISPKGCAERMEIVRSSGVESLDAAALEWTEGLRFLPAQADGKAQAASYTFGVTFKLTE
jgi:TonB family protein